MITSFELVMVAAITGTQHLCFSLHDLHALITFVANLAASDLLWSTIIVAAGIHLALPHIYSSTAWLKPMHVAAYGSCVS